jgi:hypothetical protein
MPSVAIRWEKGNDPAASTTARVSRNLLSCRSPRSACTHSRVRPRLFIPTAAVAQKVVAGQAGGGGDAVLGGVGGQFKGGRRWPTRKSGDSGGASAQGGQPQRSDRGRDQSDIGGRVQLELFDDQPLHACGGGPVDALKAVSCGVFAESGDAGGDLMGASMAGLAAGEFETAGSKVAISKVAG